MCARSLRNKVAEIDETDWLHAMLVSVAGWRGLSRGHFRGSSLQIDNYQEVQTTCTTMINCNAVYSSMHIVTYDRHLWSSESRCPQVGDVVVQKWIRRDGRCPTFDTGPLYGKTWLEELWASSSHSENVVLML